ncbi:regulator of chromosome condensation 1/beta-lactamase-inhibitor protein II [Geranomyces variabilis]|nr:regulator of chromosome condensation 1/beta-lactamase-inhibitor protein II [Geranomyces variabilis]
MTLAFLLLQMIAPHARTVSLTTLRFACRRPPCPRRYSSLPVANTSIDTVWSWGAGSDGRLGHGEQVSLTSPKPIQALAGCKVITVECGVSHSVALLGAATGGHVFSWGSNFYGQAGHIPESSGFLDEDDDDQLSIPTAVKGSLQDKDIAQIACGDFHTLALTRNGDVHSWGAGILGHGSEYNDSNPLPITFFADVARRPIRVAARHTTSCALAVPISASTSASGASTSDVELYAWGHLGANEKARSPVLVARALSSALLNRGSEAIEALACGDGCVAVAGAVTDGSRRLLVFGKPASDAADVTAPNYPMPRETASPVVEVWTAPPSVDLELPNIPVKKLLCGQGNISGFLCMMTARQRFSLSRFLPRRALTPL